MRSPTCLLESPSRKEGGKRISSSEPGQLQEALEGPGPDPAGHASQLSKLHIYIYRERERYVYTYVCIHYRL